MPDPRPTPITITDDLLSAILDELQGLRADLGRGRGGDVEQPLPGRVELREPAPAPAPAPTPIKSAPAKKAARSRRRED